MTLLNYLKSALREEELDLDQAIKSKFLWWPFVSNCSPGRRQRGSCLQPAFGPGHPFLPLLAASVSAQTCAGLTHMLTICLLQSWVSNGL